jgi:hypothetical protein
LKKIWRTENVMRHQGQWFQRLLNKLLHDLVPAALASVIGGILFTHFHLGFQFGRAPEAAAQVMPASAEMMQLLRDEHGLVVSYVNAQRARDERAVGANDAAPRRVADQQPKSAAALHPTYSDLAAKAVAARGKNVGSALIPLQIAQIRNEDPKPSSRNDESLLTKTVSIKDHVVAVTQRVVSVIGGIPSWIGVIGDRIGGDGANPRPPANLVSAS